MESSGSRSGDNELELLRESELEVHNDVENVEQVTYALESNAPRAASRIDTVDDGAHDADKESYNHNDKGQGVHVKRLNVTEPARPVSFGNFDTPAPSMSGVFAQSGPAGGADYDSDDLETDTDDDSDEDGYDNEDFNDFEGTGIAARTNTQKLLTPEEAQAEREKYMKSCAKPILKAGKTKVSLADARLFGIPVDPKTGKPNIPIKKKMDKEQVLQKKLRMRKILEPRGPTEITERNMIDDDNELTFKPAADHGALGHNPFGEGEKRGPFLKAAEKKEALRKQKLQDEIGKVEYEARVNKAFCPHCGVTQSYKQYEGGKKNCATCRVPFIMRRMDQKAFEDRQEKARLKKERKMKETISEMYGKEPFKAREPPKTAYSSTELKRPPLYVKPPPPEKKTFPAKKSPRSEQAKRMPPVPASAGAAARAKAMRTSVACMDRPPSKRSERSAKALAEVEAQQSPRVTHTAQAKRAVTKGKANKKASAAAKASVEAKEQEMSGDENYAFDFEGSAPDPMSPMSQKFSRLTSM